MRRSFHILTFVILLGGIFLWPTLQIQGTINKITARDDYTANGSTPNFTYTFRIQTKNDIEVLIDRITKIVDTDYTVSGVGKEGGGSVTFRTAPANTAVVTLLRKQPYEQQIDKLDNQSSSSRGNTIKKDLDKAIPTQQMMSEQLALAPKLSKKKNSAIFDQVPTKNDRFLRWLNDGSKLKAVTSKRPEARNFTATGSVAVRRTVTNKLGDILSVKDFGAKGDGATDDTAAIQAAIDAAEAISVIPRREHPTVFFPPGNYNISKGLTIETSINLFAFGGARLPQAALNKQGDFVGLTVTASCHIEGILVDGRYSPKSVNNAHGVVIREKSTFIGQANNNGGHGLLLAVTTSGDNVNASVIDGEFSGNGVDGVRVDDIVNLLSPDANVIQFRHVYAKSNKGEGVHLRNGKYAWGWIESDSNSGTGLKIDATNTGAGNARLFVYAEGNGTDISIVEASGNEISGRYTSSSVEPDKGNVLVSGTTKQVFGAALREVEVWQNQNAANNSSHGLIHKIVGSSAVTLYQTEYLGTGTVRFKSDPDNVRAGSTTITHDINGFDADVELKGKRLSAPNGTDVVAGDFALSSGWGNAATVAVLDSSSNDSRGRIRVTCGGSGIAANPRITLTFRDGAWSEKPFAIAVMEGTSDVVSFILPSTTKTKLVMTLNATPVDTKIYDIVYIVLG